MADVTTTSIGPFIPAVWANEALKILRSIIVMLPLVTKDYDLATFQVGNTLHIPYPGTLVANDKAQGSAVTLQVPSTTDTTVTLNKHKEATVLIEDFARAQAQPILMASLINSQIVAIAEQMEQDVIATYSAFSGSLGTAGTDLTAAMLRAASKKFTDNKVPRGNRHLLISTKDSNSIQADASLQSFFAFNSHERGDITNGLIHDNLYGLALHESQLVPVVAGTPNITNNLAFDPGAIIMASRSLPDAPAGTGVAQTSVTDPVSGVVLRCSMAYSPLYLGVQITFDVLYGVAKLFDAKGFVVLS
jgi:hypothetical protein